MFLHLQPGTTLSKKKNLVFQSPSGPTPTSISVQKILKNPKQNRLTALSSVEKNFSTSHLQRKKNCKPEDDAQ